MLSKVKALYEESIRALIKDVLEKSEIDNAEISIEDSGSLPFVIMARLEAAIRQFSNKETECYPDLISENAGSSEKDRFRLSRLYLPGNNPAMMLNAGVHSPDGIILDLEDSVAPEKKEEARFLVRNALRQVNFYGAERMVRINQVPGGIEDLKYIIPHHVNMILIPKCENAEQISRVEMEIDRLKKISGITSPVWLMPIIESALGVENAFKIAKSSPNIAAMAIGLEDFTADLGVQRTQEAFESLYARSRLVNACKAARIQAIDSVFSDVADEEGLRSTIKISKSLGFEGMGCIHPRQIKVIHESYAPEPDEIEKAEKIINAFILAGEKGLGVVALGSKMIDPPVVKRAQKIMDQALSLNLIQPDWRKKYEG